MSLLRRTTCRLCTHRPLLTSVLSPRSSTISLLRVQRSYATQDRPTPPRKTRRENIYTLPNFLTMTRIAACPVLGWSIVNGDFITATGLLAYSGITDWVRPGNLVIPIGSDPIIRSDGWVVSSEVQHAYCPRQYLGSCGRQSAYDDTYRLTGL